MTTSAEAGQEDKSGGGTTSRRERPAAAACAAIRHSCAKTVGARAAVALKEFSSRPLLLRLAKGLLTVIMFICIFLPDGSPGQHQRLELPRKPTDIGVLPVISATLKRDNIPAQTTAAGTPAALGGEAAFIIEMSQRTYMFDTAGAKTDNRDTFPPTSNCTNGIPDTAGTATCVTTPQAVQGEFGDHPHYKFFQVAVTANPRATEDQLVELFNEDLELEICFECEILCSCSQACLALPLAHLTNW